MTDIRTFSPNDLAQALASALQDEPGLAVDVVAVGECDANHRRIDALLAHGLDVLVVDVGEPVVRVGPRLSAGKLCASCVQARGEPRSPQPLRPARRPSA